MKFVNSDYIISQLGYIISDDISEYEIIENIASAISAFDVPMMIEELVTFIEVSNYKAELPHYFNSVIQIAKNNRVDSISNNSNYQDICKNSADNLICFTQDGEPVNYDNVIVKPYFDLKCESSLFVSNDIFNRCYSPVRLANSSFFNSLVCSSDNKDCNILFENSAISQTQYEYNIYKDTILQFNFEKGLIILAYNKLITDKNGLPLIPDDFAVIEAVKAFIEMKVMEKRFYLGKQGADGKLQYAIKKWEKYVKMGLSKAKMPKTIDDYENLLSQRNYLIPRTRLYSSFFNTLNNPETWKRNLNT